VQQAKGEAQKQFGNAREDVKKSHS